MPPLLLCAGDQPSRASAASASDTLPPLRVENSNDDGHTLQGVTDVQHS